MSRVNATDMIYKNDRKTREGNVKKVINEDNKIKVRLQGNIIGSLVLILLFFSCKNETVKNDLSMIGGVKMNAKNSKLLEQNNWKLRRLLIFDTTNDSAQIIKEKEFNKSVRFKDSLIF
ncbi:hypothetical protein [Chryseobacterium hagamense]|uniref:Uncharacterized protein n=1 Tax=Chryseobacterium hagamense TaxID=395935 RepID=A0A511YNW7_9FLAO|nr:hypothetical protein [Chryseobacterium hagamense]GEN76891.1 hypothetical protein CHA01nite_26310 [Chryseobacterium hagamense]